MDYSTSGISTSVAVVFIIIANLSAGGAQLTISPNNTATRLGETIRLTCSVILVDSIVFTFTRAGNNRTVEIGNANQNVTFINEQFSRSHVLHYTNEQHTDSSPPAGILNGVDFSEGAYAEDVTETTPADEITLANNDTSKSVLLEIAEADYDNAGTYGCRSVLTNVTFMAEVVVLGDIQCDNDLTDNQAMLGDTFSLTCHLPFCGSLTPVMQWYSAYGPTPNSQRRVIINRHLFGSVSYSVSVNATETLHGHRFTCDVTISATNITSSDGGTTSRAVNQPDYLIRYNSDPVAILYVPRLILIPSRLAFHVGEAITVLAEARPAVARLSCVQTKPDMVHLALTRDNGDEYPSKAVTIPVTEDMVGEETFRCSADNVINGVKYTTTKTMHVDVFKASPGAVNILVVFGSHTLWMLT